MDETGLSRKRGASCCSRSSSGAWRETWPSWVQKAVAAISVIQFCALGFQGTVELDTEVCPIVGKKVQPWLPGVLRREASVRYDLSLLRLSSRLSVTCAWGGRKTWHRWDPQPQSSRLHAVVLGPCDCNGPQIQNALLHHIVPWRGGSRENGDGEGRIPCFHSIAPLPSSEKPYKALSGQESRFLEDSSWCDTIKVPQMSIVSPSVCCVRVGLGKR